ncbi:MAG: alpha/beta fold hydrolase [Deltaproteobacteria bacterium]|nr:alpha/beta fold hydrolase [Deltaproteobacteria bacterium]
MMSIAAPVPRRGAVVLVHGAGSGSSAIWDLRFRDYSMMRALACAGFDTYAVDVRGFGGSSRPIALELASEAGPPAVRAEEAARDLGAAVAFAAATSSVSTVDIVAWSWGCDVTGLYAGREPGRVRRLVLYAPVYDRRWPARHKTRGAWRVERKHPLLELYDPQREEWTVWVEHVDAMFRFAGGDELRLPNGPYRDLYGPDAPVWDAAKIRAPVLIVRGDKDPASLEVHARRLYDALIHAPERRYLLVAGASHFLPRERRYKQLQGAVLDFLTTEPLLVPE